MYYWLSVGGLNINGTEAERIGRRAWRIYVLKQEIKSSKVLIRSCFVTMGIFIFAKGAKKKLGMNLDRQIFIRIV